MKQSLFVSAILKWYKIHKRDLPWRNTDNPYFIWLSEVILQQTRVNQGLPYYHAFTKAFPDIRSLASSSEQKVLSLWQGLGYYSRARNLRESAKTLVSTNKGLLPDNYNELLKVKGIGPYTAAAIASFAYKERVPVVDGNVYRVLSRVFGVETDISSTSGIKEFNTLAWKLIPDEEHDTYNQAIMEFGALQCTPGLPDCESCPIKKACFAYRNDLQNVLPVKTKSLKKKIRYFNYLCFQYKNSYIMKERTTKDIWKGLYEFPMVESASIQPLEKVLKDLHTTRIVIDGQSKIYKHILSHQTIYAQFWILNVKEQKYFNKLSNENNSLHFSEKQIKILPKPVLITKFLEDYIFN